MSIYAQDGVDFQREHEVVDVFRRLYELTKPFTKDLEEWGIYPPEDIGYFSDAVVIDTGELADKTGRGKIAIAYGMDGAGTKPMAHRVYRRMMEGKGIVEKSEIAKAVDVPRVCVGIDTIAMVANDLVAGGARPAHILDYVAWEETDVEIARDLAHGLLIGAKLAGATVVGGENASLREMIRGYDICASGAGFILNPYYIDNPLSGELMEEGDAIVGICSSGVHCNGISTLRRRLIRFPDFGWEGGYNPEEIVPELGRTAVEEILTPTLIYKGPVLDGVLQDRQFTVKAVVNVTGEGIHNLKRPLSKTRDLGARINLIGEEKLRPQPIFGLVQKHGGIPDREMWEMYNMNIGNILVLPREQTDAVIDRLEEYKVGGVPILASVIGDIIEDDNHSVFLETKGFKDVY